MIICAAVAADAAADVVGIVPSSLNHFCAYAPDLIDFHIKSIVCIYIISARHATLRAEFLLLIKST